MGIVNRTPDSFYDGGRMGLDESVDHALRLVAEGAELLDVGGVKGGPGPDVGVEEELARVMPLLEELSGRTSVPLSVETGRPEVARRALDAGATWVNDVTGLAEAALARVCAERSARIVLMHNGGQLRGRPRNPRYADVIADVKTEWERLATLAMANGVARDDIVVDAGLDFGKNTFHSLELMRRLDELVATGWPVLVAPSRKDVVGESLGVALAGRLEGTLALVALSVWSGAAIVRVHDVAASVRTVQMVEAVAGRRTPRAPIRGLWD